MAKGPAVFLFQKNRKSTMPHYIRRHENKKKQILFLTKPNKIKQNISNIPSKKLKNRVLDSK